jgi:uncharacterized protein (TIGR03382 family)
LIRTRTIVALCALALAAGTAGFVRSTTSDPPNPAMGKWLWWGSRNLTFFVNATSATTQPCGDPTAATSLTIASVQTWADATYVGTTSACTDLSLGSSGQTSQIAIGYDGMNLIVFRSGFCDDVVPGDPCHAAGTCSAKFNCWEHGDTVLGLTTVTYDPASGQILDADIEVNGWNGQPGGGAPPRGAFLTCGKTSDPICPTPPYGHSACNYYDVGDIVTHEAGHFLGLDHTCNPAYPSPYNACPAGSVMAPTTTAGDTSRRVLSQDDVTAVCTIYPAGGPTLTSPLPPPSGSSHGGCSSTGGGVSLLGVAFALAALRRRR